MKALKSIILLGIVMVFVISNAVYAANFTTKVSQKTVGQRLMITHVVHIDNSSNFTSNGVFYRVAITDERGNMVFPPQNYVPGKWDYSFEEFGNFYGTRIATMIRDYEPLGNFWLIMPHKLSGIFTGGQVYQFLLKPDPFAKPRETDRE